MAIDDDLQGIWIYTPESDWDARPEYGAPPFRFRPIRQNGSRLHLRMITPDGKDARYADDVEIMAGQFIERRAYTSDIRRGRFWRKETSD